MGLNVDRVILVLRGLQCSPHFPSVYMLGKMDDSHSLEHHTWRNTARAELGREMP